MILEMCDDFDPEKIAESGQCFRWTKMDSRTFRILAAKKCLYLTSREDGCYDLDCSEEEYESFWQDYFDLKEDYRAIRERINPGKDAFLWQASEQEKGIRILRQDPWEALITFIISQNRNIPAIRRSVELLAASCGEKRTDRRGMTYFAFPEPEEVAGLSEEKLKDCRLGYRCGYVKAAAEAAAAGKIDFEALRNVEEKSTLAALTALYGVGVKVASCVSLFGLHHLDAFPIDVWMKRILAQEYPDGYPFEEYSPYNGAYQQYMFAYYRHRAQG